MSNNLIIEVNGRFGNHLHQIMAGVSLAKDNNLNLYINSTNKHWQFENYLINKIPTLNINKTTYRHIGVPATEHFKIDFSAETTYLTGYFLNYKWHLHNRDYLMDWLKFRPEHVEKAKHILSTIGPKICSIHVRRDDYLSLDYYAVLGEQYYKKAIDNIDKNFKYLVCSDDIAWCKTIFKGDEYYFSNEEFIIDFLMMMECDVNIIANSSFSYCSAYLNKKSAVYYPYKWSGYFANDGTAIDELCLPQWNKIKYDYK